jgi:hypothetical protein
MTIPKNEIRQAAKLQRNWLIKLALLWVLMWACLADWLLSMRRKYPEPPIGGRSWLKGDLVDLTVNRKGKR